jgi:hypothetical protein
MHKALVYNLLLVHGCLRVGPAAVLSARTTSAYGVRRWRIKVVIFVSLVLAMAYLVMAEPVVSEPKFSLDPASPAIAGDLTPDDVLTPGPVVLIHGSSLGLQDSFLTGVFDNLEALSFGKDPIRNPLFFSVDRVAVGLPGTAVFFQAQPGVEEAHGDVYVSLPPFGSNALVIDEEQLGLTPGFFGDDLDGLELDTNPPPVYFSLDALSASNGFGAGSLANDIFLNSLGNIVCEGESQIGLDPGDDLDALVFDAATNTALFSLSTFSPSTFTASGTPYRPGVKGFLSPADILITRCTGSFSLWAAAADLGLRPDDNVDALDTVPEPATIGLMALGLIGLVVSRYRFRRPRGV